MTGVRSEDDKIASKSVLAQGIPPLSKINIDMKCELRQGEPSRLSAQAKIYSRIDGAEYKLSASSVGAPPEAARSAPLTSESVTDRLAKLGATPFVMGECSVPLDEGINLSPSAINALRREACEELVSGAAKTLDELLGKDKITVPRVEFKLDSTAPVTRKTTALFHDTTALSELLSRDKEALSDIDVAFVPLFDIDKISSGNIPFQLGVYLPPVIMESEWDEVRMALDVAVTFGVKAALIGNISHIELIKDTPLTPYGDLRLNTSNRYSRAVLSALGVDEIILSPSLLYRCRVISEELS
jgi:putative protease